MDSDEGPLVRSGPSLSLFSCRAGYYGMAGATGISFALSVFPFSSIKAA
jgi:hypothetical protein